MKRQCDPEVRRALDATGLPWVIVPGTKHYKIILAGHMVGLIKHGGATPRGSWRGTKNVLAAIRRAAREHRLAGGETV